MTQLLNKISTKAAGVQPTQGVTEKDADGKQTACAVINDAPLTKAAGNVPLLRILGVATSCKAKTSDYGDSYEFRGTFEATRVADGEVMNSSKLFLPKVMEGLLASQIMTPKEDGTDADPVNFAVDIGVKYSDNLLHYEWTVSPLLSSAVSVDPLAHIRAGIEKPLDATTAPAVDKAKGKK